MEPRIQYAKTSDGVNIAYWTLGEGLPLVIMPAGIFSHIQLEWQAPELRRWYERLSETRRLVRYDDRGVGLSDRDVIDFSLFVVTGGLGADNAPAGTAVLDSDCVDTNDVAFSAAFPYLAGPH